MEFQVSEPAVFPDGTSVGLYKPDQVPDPEKAPTGAPSQEVVVENDKATFAGVEEATNYIAGANMGTAEAPNWRYIRFTTAVPVLSSSYVSAVDAEVEVKATEPTVIDRLDAVQVSESGRLEISYACLYKHLEFVENEAANEGKGNYAKIELLVDGNPIEPNDGNPEGFVGTRPAGEPDWAGLQTTKRAEILGMGERGRPPIVDAPRYGNFAGPDLLTIMAEPGPHTIEVVAHVDAVTGGVLHIKDRRLVAITGTA